jgi:hypothetical protein
MDNAIVHKGQNRVNAFGGCKRLHCFTFRPILQILSTFEKKGAQAKSIRKREEPPIEQLFLSPFFVMILFYLSYNILAAIFS